MFALLVFLSPFTVSAQPAERVDHVLLIGLDGARPEHLREHAGPTLRRLIDDGAVCWQAQAVTPSVTQVNWASMLSGSVPAKHGIDRHPVEREELESVQLKATTVFDVLAEHNLTATAFLGHWKLYPLERPANGIRFEHSPGGAEAVAPLVGADLRANGLPTFCFVWIGNLDGAGHRHGWMSPEQLAVMPTIDTAVAQILEPYRERRALERTLVLISSDHGGHGKGHGEGTAEDVTIPWIAWGPGVRRGHEVRAAISTCDTAATILHALRLPVPEGWDGRPVMEALLASAASASDRSHGPAQPFDP